MSTRVYEIIQLECKVFHEDTTVNILASHEDG